MKYVPRTKPFPHQAKATLRLLRHGSYALFMEPRLGKSKAALDAAAIKALQGEVERVAILAPLIAQDVWRTELRKHFPFAYIYEMPDEIVKLSSRPLPLVEFRFWNYEKVARRERGRRKYHYRYVDEIERWGPDVLICDESHRLKRAGGVTAQATWRMVRRIRESRQLLVYLLTGTPNPKGWIDLFAQFRVMDETIFGTNKGDFEEEYCIYGHGRQRWTILKYQNKKKLLERVRQNSFSVSAEAVGMAGKLFFQTIRYELPQKARRQYNEMAEELITNIQGQAMDAANAGVKRLRLLQIAGGFTTDGREIHHSGLASFEAWARDLLEQGQSLVVYARFRPEIDAIVYTLQRLDVPVHELHGRIRRSDRAKQVEDFQRSSTPAVMVAQPQVGSLSIELTAAAEVAFYSLPDAWQDFKQCYDRVRGPNQKRPVRVTCFLARGTVHVSVLAGLRHKEDQHQLLMRGPRRYLLGI